MDKWPDWLDKFYLSTRDYDVPSIACEKCLEDVADHYFINMTKVLEAMECHWKEKHV